MIQSPGIARAFDFVSRDDHVVGDTKLFPSGRRRRSGASTTFLVFGNQRETLQRWLSSGVAFFFLSEAGTLEQLAGPQQ
jgi:hypothetical protein